MVRILDNRLSRMLSSVFNAAPLHREATTVHQIEEMVRAQEGVTENNALRVAAVYACVSLLARSQAMLPLNLYRRGKDGSETVELDSAVSDVLAYAPNRWQTPYDFESMMTAHKLIRGNAYAYISRLAGTVQEIIPLNPARMTPRQKDDLSIEYVYRLKNGSERVFRQEDIHHRRGLSVDGIVGLSPIAAARQAIGLAMRMEEHSVAVFTNAAKPSGVLTSPKALTPEGASRLKTSFDMQFAGSSNAGGTIVLEDGLDWKQVGMSAEDLQFMDGRKLQRNEIAMFFGVPPHMIGDIDRGTSWGSGIEQQSLGFLTHTLNPHLVADRQALTRDLLSKQERRKFSIKHDTSTLTRAEFLTRQQGLEIQYSNGVINADEWRKIEGLNPRADGKGGEYVDAGGAREQRAQVGQQAQQDPAQDDGAQPSNVRRLRAA